MLYNTNGSGESNMVVTISNAQDSGIKQYKHRYSRSMHVMSTSWDLDSSGLRDAILNLLILVRSYTILDSRSSDSWTSQILECCSYLVYKLRYRYFRFGRSPSCISHFRLSRTTLPTVSLDGWNQKTLIWHLKNRFYIAYRLICMSISWGFGMEASILNSTSSQVVLCS